MAVPFGPVPAFSVERMVRHYQPAGGGWSMPTLSRTVAPLGSGTFDLEHMLEDQRSSAGPVPVYVVNPPGEALGRRLRTRDVVAGVLRELQRVMDTDEVDYLMTRVLPAYLAAKGVSDDIDEHEVEDLRQAVMEAAREVRDERNRQVNEYNQLAVQRHRAEVADAQQYLRLLKRAYADAQARAR